MFKHRLKVVMTHVGIDYIDLKRRLPGESFNELALVYLFFKKMNMKGLMLDVGAHYGESFVPYLGRGWTVHAFEPDPNPHKAQVLSMYQRKFQHLQLHRDAVSNENDLEVPFYISEESTGVSSLIPFTDRHVKSTAVRTITLEKFATLNNVMEVDYLKIDTEGNDLYVLQGFPWSRMKPKILVCEYEDNKTRKVRYTYGDLGDYLLRQEYSVYMSEWYPIVSYGGKHKWRSIRKYPCEATDENGWGNYIAVEAKYSRSFMSHLEDEYGVSVTD